MAKAVNGTHLTSCTTVPAILAGSVAVRSPSKVLVFCPCCQHLAKRGFCMEDDGLTWRAAGIWMAKFVESHVPKCCDA
jgi:hypothetical protein